MERSRKRRFYVTTLLIARFYVARTIPLSYSIVYSIKVLLNVLTYFFTYEYYIHGLFTILDRSCTYSLIYHAHDYFPSKHFYFRTTCSMDYSLTQSLTQFDRSIHSLFIRSMSTNRIRFYV